MINLLEDTGSKRWRVSTVKSRVFCSLDIAEWFSSHRLDFSIPKRFSNQLKMQLNRNKLFFPIYIFSNMYFFTTSTSRKLQLKRIAYYLYMMMKLYEKYRVWFECFWKVILMWKIKNIPETVEKIWSCQAARIARWESSSNTFRVVVKCYFNRCLKTLACHGKNS